MIEFFFKDIDVQIDKLSNPSTPCLLNYLFRDILIICRLFILQVARKGKHILPLVARACLVSTFFEDGIRMWTQWNEQREYMDISWGCGWFLATMFVVINLLGQLGGVGMVMTRFRVEIACGVLFFIVVLQVNTFKKKN